MTSMAAELTEHARGLLGHWRLPDQVPQLLKYRENAVFRVSLADGDRAALRLHRPGYHARAALVSELAWMADLRRHGILVPEPIPSVAGDLVVTTETGDGVTRHADLIGWVDGVPLGETGRPLGPPPEQLKEIFGAIGRQMARMHACADLYIAPPDFERPSWNAAGLLGEDPFWGRFWDCAGLDVGDATFLSGLRGELTGRLDALSGSFDKGLIHADLVRENIFVDKGSVAFIDFDDCGFGFRLFDIATALLRNRAEPDFPLIRTAMLEGYCAIRPQIAKELAHLPLFLLLRSLTYIGWAGARPELPDAGERLRRYIAEARDLAGLLEAA